MLYFVLKKIILMFKIKQKRQKRKIKQSRTPLQPVIFVVVVVVVVYSKESTNSELACLVRLHKTTVLLYSVV